MGHTHEGQPHGGGDHGGGHSHAVRADADRRYLWIALLLILALMAGEVVVGVLTGSLALLADAGHMVSDAGAIGLALVAMVLSARPAGGAYTFGLKRVEIISALINGVTLALLAVFFTVMAVIRLVAPPEVDGGAVFIVALVGIAVNILATWSLSRANRQSLNVEGSFQHILTDLYAFIGTAVAGGVIYATGFMRADAIASLLVAALMLKAGASLVREGGRVVLEAAPRGVDPVAIGVAMATDARITEVHDLHVWEVTSGFPSLSAHVLVADEADCHGVRADLEGLLHERFGVTHTTLQVDHVSSGEDVHGRTVAECPEPVSIDQAVSGAAPRPE